MESLIAADSTFAIWAMLVGLAGFGLWAEHTRLGQKVSGVGLVILLAIALSNLRIIPQAAPAYDVVMDFLVPVAIPLLLYRASLRRLLAETGTMLKVFAAATLGTTLGAVLAFQLLPLGQQASTITGAMTATYIGGSMNYVAVGSMLDMDPALFAAGNAADNLVGSSYLVLLALLPSLALARRLLPATSANHRASGLGSGRVSGLESGQEPGRANGETPAARPFNPIHIALGLGLSLSICQFGYWLASATGLASYAILFITAITIVIANLFHRPLERLSGQMDTAMLLMYIFFVAIGAGCDISVLLHEALAVIGLAAIILSVHFTFVLASARLFGAALDEVIIASIACASGPSTAAALAGSKGWHALVTPGILCGTAGYVIASFIGMAVASWLG